jgi:hypothetical protein
MLMNRQNSSFSSLSSWSNNVDLFGDTKILSSSQRLLNIDPNARQPSDYESVLDDLFLDAPVSTQSQFFDEREYSPVNSTIATPSPSVDFNRSPQQYQYCDSAGPSRLMTNTYPIQIEPAQEAPPPYDAIKNERFTESPQSDSPTHFSQSSRVSQSNHRSVSSSVNSRFSAGPYGRFKDDSGKIDIHQIPDETERKKVLEKREKNRIAAARARNRKREKTEILEEEKANVQNQINSVDIETQRLTNLRNTLRVVANEHDKLCPYLAKHSYH